MELALNIRAAFVEGILIEKCLERFGLGVSRKLGLEMSGALL